MEQIRRKHTECIRELAQLEEDLELEEEHNHFRNRWQEESKDTKWTFSDKNFTKAKSPLSFCAYFKRVIYFIRDVYFVQVVIYLSGVSHN